MINCRTNKKTRNIIDCCYLLLWSKMAERLTLNKADHCSSVNDFNILQRTDNGSDSVLYQILLVQRDPPSLNSQQSSIHA